MTISQSTLGPKGAPTTFIPKLTGSITGVVTAEQDYNYITDTGSANTLVGTLTDATGVLVTVQAGLRVLLKTANATQVGANTFNLNSHGADALVQGSGTNSNLKTVFAAGAIMDLVFDGTRWQMLGRNQ